VEVAANNLVLRPHNQAYPVEVLPMEEGKKACDRIVGRVCYVAIETRLPLPVKTIFGRRMILARAHPLNSFDSVALNGGHGEALSPSREVNQPRQGRKNSYDADFTGTTKA